MASSRPLVHYIRRHRALSKIAVEALYLSGRYNRKAVQEEIERFEPATRGAALKSLTKDILYCRYRYRIGPHEYFLFRLGEKTDEERAQFIGSSERKDIVNALNRGHDSWKIIQNKYLTYEAFKRWYRREVIELKEEADREKALTFIARHGRIAVKPRDGKQGQGVFLYDPANDKRTPDELISELIGEDACLLEEIIRQDPRMAAFHPDSVNTVRVMTCYDRETDEVRRVFGVLRMGRKGSFIDNASSGGIIAGLDVTSGTVITPGFTETGFDTYAAHPDTGAQIKGAQIPEWEALCQTLEELARVLREQKMTGWDLALGDKGWTMIETNYGASYVGIQMTTGKGIRPVIEGAVGHLVP